MSYQCSSAVLRVDTGSAGVFTASATYIQRSGTSSGFFVAVNVPELDSDGPELQLHASMRALMSSRSVAVQWVPVAVQEAHSLKWADDFVAKLSGGAELVPSNGPDKTAVRLHVLRLTTDALKQVQGALRQRTKRFLRPLVRATQITSGSRLHVLCVPFGNVNPYLFVDYEATGSISYVDSSTEHSATNLRPKVGCILSDIRYLQGMNGGIAILQADHGPSEAKIKSMPPSNPSESVGLVVGGLQSRNGDGLMTLIASWDSILATVYGREHQLGQIQARLKQQVKSQIRLEWPVDTYAAKAASLLPYSSLLRLALPQPLPSVVSLTVLRGSASRTTWASGVILDEHTVVTNAHVVADAKVIVCRLTSSFTIDMQTWSVPLNGLDLAFLKPVSDKKALINNHTDHLLGPARLARHVPRAGDPVISSGFGLYEPSVLMDPKPNRSLHPLRSAGTVSKVVSLRFNKKDRPDPILMLTSASCWNGCSGGAVIEAASGHLLGIIAGNGRVHSTGLAEPQLAFAIPTAVVAMAWTLSKQSMVQDVPEDAVRLWQLRGARESKL